MKTLRRILFALLILLVLLIGAAVLIPYLFKDQIVRTTKQLINEQVDAKVDFQDVSLSLFRHFPDLTLSLDELTVDGNAPFEGIRLLDLQRLNLNLELFPLIFGNGEIILSSLSLIQPDLKVYVLENGKANYDIAKSTEAATDTLAETSSGDFNLQLKSYEIVEGKLLYDDRPAELYTEVEGLNHKGSGNFSQSQFDLSTLTSLKALTVRSGGTNYLTKTKLELASVLSVDQDQQRYTLKKTDLKLNDLDLLLSGVVGLADPEKIELDLSLEAPGNKFREVLSLIPGAYTEDFSSVQTEGSFSLSASTKGVYDIESESYPAFQLDLNIKDGSLKYPDLPLPVTNIQLTSKVAHPGGDLDNIRVNLDPFQLQIGDNPFGGMLKLKRPMSDPDIDTRIKGTIDLASLGQAIPMEGIDELSGRIQADMAAKASMSQIESGSYQNVNVSGRMDASGLRYTAVGQPPITIEKAGMTFSPQFVELESFDVQLGKSDLKGSGRIDNVLAYFAPDKTMTGKLTVQSTFMDANEWATESEPVDAQQKEIEMLNAEAEQEKEDAAVFDRFDFSMDAQFDQIVYEEYDLKNVRAIGQLSPKALRVRELGADIGTSDLLIDGELLHIWDYLFNAGMLVGKIGLKSKRLNLNELLGLDEEVSEDPPVTSDQVEEGEVYQVPDNLNLVVDADLGRVDYTNMTLNNLQGSVLVKDEAVILDDVKANTLGGRVNLTGRYDSKGEGNPQVAMKMGLDKMAFNSVFNTFNTFERLAPIGKFVNGIFNTSILFESEMGENMYPVLSTINAEGFLETLDAVLQQYKPVTAIGNALNVQELKEAIALQNTRNWFEIRQGMVEIKPIDIPIKDMNFLISGRQGLGLDMDYTIDTRLPRSVWESNAAGAAASAGIDKLREQANQLGVQWDKSEFIDLRLKLGGKPNNPSVKVNLLGTEGSASVGDAVKGKVEDEAGELLDQGKEEAQAILDQAKDSALNKSGELLDEVMGNARESVKDSNTQKAIDSLSSAIQKGLGKAVGDSSKTVETIKEELERFNPFKRKKNPADTAKKNN